MGGVIIEKAFAEKQGKNYGTPAGSIMCTGDYKLKSWTPGVGVTAVVNPNYWNSSVHPMVQQILIKGVPDATSLTSGMLTGAIQGSYYFGLSTLSQLQDEQDVKVYQGPGWETDAFVVSATSGPLANVKVRQALSLALNRQSIISQVYDGAALMPRWLANPGTFGYGTPVFNAAYDTRAGDEAEPRGGEEAGAAGRRDGPDDHDRHVQPDRRASPPRPAPTRRPPQAIGLKVKLDSVSADNYINFFTSAQARKGVDGFITVNYGDYADPAALLATVALPGGSQNYDNFNNPQITSLLGQARGTANADARASAGRQGRATGRAAAAVDPRRAAEQRADAERQPDRRGRLVRLHVRAVGRQPRREVSAIARVRFLVRRLAMLVGSLLVASFVIFGALYLAPGSALAALSGGRALPPSSVAILDQRYHLNEPFLAQYWYWLDGVLHGNLGISITLRENVSTLIGNRIWTTAGLVLYASLIICVPASRSASSRACGPAGSTPPRW